MKVAIVFSDVEFENGHPGVAMSFHPMEAVDEEAIAKTPTKAMWIASTIVDMFNSGDIQQHALAFISRNQGVTQPEGTVYASPDEGVVEE